jgi:hypothetical protein
VTNGKTARGDWWRGAGTNGIEGSTVPVGHDVAFGGDANTRRKIYSADADWEDQTSKKSVYWALSVGRGKAEEVKSDE